MSAHGIAELALVAWLERRCVQTHVLINRLSLRTPQAAYTPQSLFYNRAQTAAALIWTLNRHQQSLIIISTNAMLSQTAVFTKRVRDHMGLPPVTVPPDAGCEHVVRLMRECAVSSAIVQDGHGRLLGIITEQDVVRRIAYVLAPDSCVCEVMNTPVETVCDSDYLYQALARMRSMQLRHMPVVDGDGQVVGILQQHDALAASAGKMMHLIERLAHRGSFEGMRETRSAQVTLARALLKDKVPAPDIQGLLTRINNDLHGRVLDLCLRDMRNDGSGAPPVDFDVIVMGSAGRAESFLNPDQDNGFILADYPDCEHGRVDAWFIELAKRMTYALNELGFDYCRGHVMAVNPLWRKSISQWKTQVDRWVEKASIPLLRLCDIFFDFMPVYGSGVVAADLRAHITEAVRRPEFLYRLYERDEEHGVALGPFGRLQLERVPGSDVGKVNLKDAGTLPLVGAVRLLALREGVTETSTMARIKALRAKGVLTADEFDYLTGAYQLITELLLTQQLGDFKVHRLPGKHIAPEALSKRRKHMLVESLKSIRSFRLRVRLELQAAAT